MGVAEPAALAVFIGLAVVLGLAKALPVTRRALDGWAHDRHYWVGIAGGTEWALGQIAVQGRAYFIPSVAIGIILAALWGILSSRRRQPP